METCLDKAKKKSMLAGMQKRNQEVIFNMLKEKADVAFISKVTGWTPKQIKKLKNGS